MFFIFDPEETQFVIGTEEAADVFTIAGDDVSPRHAWVWIADEHGYSQLSFEGVKFCTLTSPDHKDEKAMADISKLRKVTSPAIPPCGKSTKASKLNEMTRFVGYESYFRGTGS
jgi:hypothetical protein